MTDINRAEYSLDNSDLPQRCGGTWFLVKCVATGVEGQFLSKLRFSVTNKPADMKGFCLWHEKSYPIIYSQLLTQVNS